MTRTSTLLAALTLLFSYSYGQTPLKPQAFEVASITPCKPGTPEPPAEHMGLVQFIYPGGRFNATATSLKYLIEWAYGIQPSQHSGGPSGMETDRYDIAAKAEGSASDDQMKLMVQTLLADRFKLKMHRERKEISAYVISLGKSTPKLFPPKDGETHALRISPDQNTHSVHVAATRYTLEQLLYVFARQMGAVILNQTGMDGEHDFSLDLMPAEDQRPTDPTLLIGALREQIGLSVKYQKAPVDIFVIDSAEKVQAGN